MLLYTVGVAGYLMRRYDFPTAPVIIGMILGPLAEQNFRQAMTISAGDWTIFFTRPLSLTILIIAAGLVVGPKLWGMRGSQPDRRAILASSQTMPSRPAGGDRAVDDGVSRAATPPLRCRDARSSARPASRPARGRSPP